MEEFEQFAASVAPMLQRTAWLLTRNAHGAEDLVQETLAKVYVAARGRRRIDNPAAYARAVLVRLHIDERRRRRSSEVVTDDLPERGHVEDAAATIALRDAVSGLTPIDQAVLVLRYYADLSVTETARDLKISEGAVRTRTSRAVARLRERLGEDFIDDTDAPARQP